VEGEFKRPELVHEEWDRSNCTTRCKEILPVAEIMQGLVAETEAALSRAVDFR
jgi:hypothetical protein